MSATDEWGRLFQGLSELSPGALSFRPPADTAAIQQAEASTTGHWPGELVEFFGLHNGQDPEDRNRYPGELLPMSLCFDLATLETEYQRLREDGQAELDDDDWMREHNEGSEAGATSHVWLAEYIPVCGLDSYYFFIDTRPGPHSGCIRRWTRDDGDNMQEPLHASITNMLSDVRHAVATGASLHELWVPYFHDAADEPTEAGTLRWRTRES